MNTPAAALAKRKAEIMTAEKYKQYFTIWNNLLMEGLDVLSREDNLELVHVQDVFEHIHLSNQDLEARLRVSLREKDTIISHMQTELDRRFEDLEDLTARQKKSSQALYDQTVSFEKALLEVEVSIFQVLKQNVAAISKLQEDLQMRTEDVEELQKGFEAANKERVLLELQLTEQEAKFKDHEAKGKRLSKILEEKERELQNLRALEKGRDLELLNTKAIFEKAKQELEAHTSRLFEERDTAISQLQEAMRKNAQGMEELQKLLVEAREETAHKETLLSESEVKLGEQVAKVHNLTATLEEKDQELQKQHAVQKRREVEIRNVRMVFEKAMEELESNTSCILTENKTMLSQLQGSLNRKSEEPEELQSLLVETACKELMLPQQEIKMKDQGTEGQNLTTIPEGKDSELQHNMELQASSGEMHQPRDHLCKAAKESRKYPVIDAEEESRGRQPSGERVRLKGFGEEETAEEELRKTPGLLHSDCDWDHCTTWWQILEGKTTTKTGKRQREEQLKMLRAKIHLKVKNGTCQM